MIVIICLATVWLLGLQLMLQRLEQNRTRVKKVLSIIKSKKEL